MNAWKKQTKPFFVLAPMDDVTDVVFRSVVERAASADLYMTEFVSTDGLDSSGRDRVMTKLRSDTASNKPLIAQIWGKDPEKYFKAAQDIVQLGGFSGIDINMGCPEKGIVARGCCGGLIGNNSLAAEIIAATQEGAGDLPVSVKSRIGIASIVTEAWYSFLLSQKLVAITVHGRTVKEMSKVPAHWDEIAKVALLRNEIAPDTLIIGNGDVRDRQHGLEMIKQTGVDGAMIGRGIFHNIFAFSDVQNDQSPQTMLAILEDHLTRYEQAWGDQKSYQILKKFYKVYINGWPGAADLRAKFMETNSADEARNLLKNHVESPKRDVVALR